MTDNEIKKALKSCRYGACRFCFYGDTDRTTCKNDLIENALDLIDRQQAEIGGLRKAIDVLDVMISQYKYELKKAKAEAIKEYIEKLKRKKHECGCNYRKKPVYAITEEKIDETYKEMAGDANIATATEKGE